MTLKEKLQDVKDKLHTNPCFDALDALDAIIAYAYYVGREDGQEFIATRCEERRELLQQNSFASKRDAEKYVKTASTATPHLIFTIAQTRRISRRR